MEIFPQVFALKSPKSCRQHVTHRIFFGQGRSHADGQFGGPKSRPKYFPENSGADGNSAKWSVSGLYAPDRHTMWGQTDDGDEEHKTAVMERIERFLTFIAGDHLVCAMITLARDENLYKPDEVIARRLDVTVNDIYIARKRLKSARRRFEKSEQNQK